MNTALAIKKLHPTAEPLLDFVLQDDGKGAFIAYWDVAKLGPQPDPEKEPVLWAQLEAAADVAELEQARKVAITANQLEAGKRIAALFGVPEGGERLLIKQLNALARVAVLQDRQIAGDALTAEEEAELESMRELNAAKDEVRAAENAAAALINAAATVEDVDQIAAPDWP